jgi:hypothetical protein
MAEEDADCRIYEYTSAANPSLVSNLISPFSLSLFHNLFQSSIPVIGYDAALHTTGPTRLIPFDLREQLQNSTQATTPNLMAHFIRICSSESIESLANATSQAFYIIRLIRRSSILSPPTQGLWSISH